MQPPPDDDVEVIDEVSRRHGTAVIEALRLVARHSGARMNAKELAAFVNGMRAGAELANKAARQERDRLSADATRRLNQAGSELAQCSAGLALAAETIQSLGQDLERSRRLHRWMRGAAAALGAAALALCAATLWA